MTVIVQSKTVKVTKAIREFCEKQCAKLLKTGQVVSQITLFLDTISRKKNDSTSSIARLSISLPGKNIVATRKANDLYQAIVDATDRANRSLRKRKEKRVKKQRNRDLGIEWMEFAH